MLLGAPGSRLLTLAEDVGLATCGEAFVDRAYRVNGELVARSQAGAVHHELGRVVAQAVRLATTATVLTPDGDVVPVRARSLCVHGDTPGAVALAVAVRESLEDAGIAVSSFA